MLPSQHSEFRTKQYWDTFFLERDRKAFEWYVQDVQDILPYIGKDRAIKILSIGCGNSEFSAQLYDAGFVNITNLDFSEVVIDEMRKKNLHRPRMQWHVGDMTSMTAYTDQSFDLVFDKGALDALMSEDSAAVRDKASDMFREVLRVLSAAGGRYLCISLAEPFIFRHLLQHFAGAATPSPPPVTLSLHLVDRPQSSVAASPFVPIVAEVVRKKSEGSRAGSPLQLHFDRFGGRTRTADGQGASLQTAAETVAHLQEFRQMRFRLGRIEPGRFETSLFWSAGGESSVPRFTVFVLDRAARASRSCAVFMVPPGREADFQFSSQDGLNPMEVLQAELSPIAMYVGPSAQSLCPADMDHEQEQIPFMALQMQSGWRVVEAGRSAMSGLFVVEEKRAGDSDQEEDSDDDEQAEAETVRRRLIFLQSQHFIQTEVRLTLCKKADPAKAKKKNKNKKKKKKSAKKSPDPNPNPNPPLPLPPRHPTVAPPAAAAAAASASASLLLAPAPAPTSLPSSSSSLQLDGQYLDGHHRCVLAALLLAPQTLLAACRRPAPSDLDKDCLAAVPLCVVVGLGGGALPMALHGSLPRLRQWVAELDPDLIPVAQRWFGFRPDSRLQTVVGDGAILLRRIRVEMDSESTALEQDAATDKGGDISLAIAAAAREIRAGGGLSLLCVDADSKDAGLGMSAPPPEFTSDQALDDMLTVLREGGVLCINIVARSAQVRRAFLDRLQARVGEHRGSRLLTGKASEDTVNVVAVVIKGGGGGAASSSPDMQDLEGLLRTWRQSSAGEGTAGRAGEGEGDPLQLLELARQFTPAATLP
eukprot:gene22612-30885_t